MTKLKVLSVTSELFPLIKTGGLADVTGALPKALAAEGADMRSLIPGYPAVLSALENAQEVLAFPGLFGTARLLAGTAHGLNLFVLEAPYLYGRHGNPYTQPDGTDWPDNAYRYAALGKVAAEIGLGHLPGFQPDVVHMHDWQAGLTAAYMHYSGKRAAATVMTVHNLAFQGQFPAELVLPLGLPPASFAWDGIEHYGSIGFLKAGLQFATRITTVSPTYAQEIMQPETGMGFDGLLRVRAANVTGILNGIDTDVWNPATDPLIGKNYDFRHLEARTANKAALLDSFGLKHEPAAPLAGIISRLTSQKGFDLLLEALPVLLDEGMQLVVLGTGDAELEEKLQASQETYSGRIGVTIGYDEALAHRIQAGVDLLLVPSRFEPCGLTQLCALRYGAVPLVARIGGLADTIVDINEMALGAGAATGLLFAAASGEGFSAALKKAARLYRDKTVWRSIQKAGMTTDVSWHRPARRYMRLYREICGLPEPAAEEDVSSNVVRMEAAGASKARTATVESSAGDASTKDASAMTATAPGDPERTAAILELPRGARKEQATAFAHGESEDRKAAVEATVSAGAVDRAAEAIAAAIEDGAGNTAFAAHAHSGVVENQAGSGTTAANEAGEGEAAHEC